MSKAPPKWSESERLAFRPATRRTIAEWVEEKRVLGPPSEVRGPLRLIRTPYLRPILDAFGSDQIEEIIICKPAQIAGTEVVISVLGYYADQEPCSIMMVMADEDTAKYISAQRIQPMFRNSPDLVGLIDESKFNITEITLRNGAYIAMGWASSVARLASRPMKVVIFDEIDKPGYMITTAEASPLSLGRERTETFFVRKIAKLSTPTVEDGNIWKEMQSCDVIYDWHVPCPICGEFQPMIWSRKFCLSFPDGVYRAEDGTMKQLGEVSWEGGRDATHAQIAAGGYRCGICGSLWDTVQKDRAVEAGKAVARGPLPDAPKKVGFHVNRLYSLLGKSGNLPKLISDYIRVVKSGDPKQLQGFINSTLAEPWKQVTVATTEANVFRARVPLPPQTVPQNAVALTCGIDVQKHGFWFRVRAWAQDMTSWGIHEGFLPTWEDIETLLFDTEYPQSETGLKFRIWRAALDTGGGEDEFGGLSRTEETEAWVRKNGVGRGCRVWGTKGASSPLQGKVQLGKPLDKFPSGRPIPGGLQLVLIDTHKMKDVFHYRLAQAIQSNSQESDGTIFHQAAFLHEETGMEYARQVMAEEKRRDPKKGIEVWVKVRRDNHLLDCEVLCHALADPEWPTGGVNLLRAPAKMDARRYADAPQSGPGLTQAQWFGNRK